MESSQFSAETASVPAVVELRVRNHPGVIAHVVGLFSRRACNIDAVICMPNISGETSTILLLFERVDKLDRMLRHVAKLEDVLVAERRDERASAFVALREHIL